MTGNGSTPDAAGGRVDGDLEVVRRALSLIGELRTDEALELMSPDLVMELPFRHDGGPSRMEGTGARSFIGALPAMFQRMDFSDIVVHGELATGWIVAEYRSHGLTRSGGSYPNVYACFVRVHDGLITHWREYFDPVIVERAFEKPAPSAP